MNKVVAVFSCPFQNPQLGNAFIGRLSKAWKYPTDLSVVVNNAVSEGNCVSKTAPVGSGIFLGRTPDSPPPMTSALLSTQMVYSGEAPCLENSLSIPPVSKVSFIIMMGALCGVRIIFPSSVCTRSSNFCVENV